MKKQRSSRDLIKHWRKGEKATIDHLVRALGPGSRLGETTHSAFTQTGLAIEDQVRKAWHQAPIGLAIF